MRTRLNPGDTITSAAGQAIRSTPNGTYEMLLLPNGMLVVRLTALPKTSTWHQPGVPNDSGQMQTNGDFVLTGPPNFYWDSTTQNYPNAYLEVTDAGHAIIYAADGTPIWDNGNRLYTIPSAVASFQQDVQRLVSSAGLLENIVLGAARDTPSFISDEVGSGSRAVEGAPLDPGEKVASSRT